MFTILLHGSSSEWNEVKNDLKSNYKKYVTLTENKFDLTEYESFINQQFEIFKSSPIDHEGRYSEKTTNFWSAATGMITETIQVPIKEKFCGQYCWGSSIVKNLQNQYLQKIYDTYNQGATSCLIDHLWSRFPSQNSFDSCKCSEEQQCWADIEALQQKFLRNAWIDFLCGKIEAFSIASHLIENWSIRVPNKTGLNSHQRWYEAKTFPISINPNKWFEWILRLTYIGVKNAGHTLRRLAYYDRGSISHVHLSLSQRLQLLKKCVFSYQIPLANMELWFVAQYNSFHETKLNLSLKKRCNILKRLILLDMLNIQEDKKDLNVCVGSFIIDEEYKIKDIPSEKIKEIAMDCGLRTSTDRVLAWYNRAKLGDHTALRGYLLACKNVKDIIGENAGMQLFENAKITSIKKEVWFKKLASLNSNLTNYTKQREKQQQLDSSSASYYKWLKTQAKIDPSSEMATEYIKHLSYLDNKLEIQAEILFFVEHGTSEAWNWCARRSLKNIVSSPEIKCLDESMLQGFFDRMKEGSLIYRHNGIPEYFKKRWKHKEAWISCICSSFDLIIKSKS